MDIDKAALDRHITKEPDTSWEDFCEALYNHCSRQMNDVVNGYMRNHRVIGKYSVRPEVDFEGSEIEERWVMKLMDKCAVDYDIKNGEMIPNNPMSIEQAAKIFERAFWMYIEQIKSDHQ